MSTVKDEADRHVNRAAEFTRIAAKLRALNGIETPLKGIYAHEGLGQVCHIDLTPERDDEAKGLLAEVLRALGEWKAEKKFDEYSGKVEHIVKSEALKIQVKIQAVPPRCEVEAYEKEVFTPARTETIRKFRLKNPEECLGTKPSV